MYTHVCFLRFYLLWSSLTQHSMSVFINFVRHSMRYKNRFIALQQTKHSFIAIIDFYTFACLAYAIALFLSFLQSPLDKCAERLAYETLKIHHCLHLLLGTFLSLITLLSCYITTFTLTFIKRIVNIYYPFTFIGSFTLFMFFVCKN